MTPFSTWITERILGEVRRAPKPEKISTVHNDIDRWLKSVDNLAKDLQALQAAKKKSTEKISKIGEKNKQTEKKEKEDVKRLPNENGSERPRNAEKFGRVAKGDKSGVGRATDGKTPVGVGRLKAAKPVRKPSEEDRDDEENLE